MCLFWTAILYSDGFTSYALQPVRNRSIFNVVVLTEKNVENMHSVSLQDHLCMSAELSPWLMHTLLLVVLVVSGTPVQLFRCTGKRSYSLEESYNWINNRNIDKSSTHSCQYMTTTAKLQKKSMKSPDETRSFDKGKVEIAKVGETSMGFLACYWQHPSWLWQCACMYWRHR
jgi:hypothetical protein